MEDTTLHPAVTLRLYTDRKCFGPGVAMLLRRVQTMHSLRSAAMDMDMAYSKAWTILREAEKGLGFKLLHSTTGGRNGGGADGTGPAAAGSLRRLRAGAEGPQPAAVPAASGRFYRRR